MAGHTAESLFRLNIASANDSVALYDAISKLSPTGVNIDWVLRAAIVFAVSALDTYFHDKIKYRVGKYDLESLPSALAKFEIPLGELLSWEKAARKGNVLRNWVVNSLATRALQAPKVIAETLKVVEITSLWDTIEPNSAAKTRLLASLDSLVQRRNQIAHEGDRLTSRKSGKQLRPIHRKQVQDGIDLVTDLVIRVEKHFPQ